MDTYLVKFDDEFISNKLLNKKKEIKINNNENIKPIFKIEYPEENYIYIELEDFLGSGNSGNVYKAKYKLVESDGEYRDIALKFTNDKQELKIIEDLNKINCEGIIPFEFKAINEYYFSIEPTKYIIGYKYMNIGTLSNFLENNKLSMKNYLTILNKVISIYECLIEYNYWYVDLKPENLLINTENKIHTVYIGDLGGLIKDNKNRVNTTTKLLINSIKKNKENKLDVLMSYEFLLFTLLIHPFLNNYRKKIYDLFFTDRDIEIDILQNEIKKLLNKKLNIKIINFINNMVENITNKKLNINIIKFCKELVNMYSETKNLDIDDNIYFKYRTRKYK